MAYQIYKKQLGMKAPKTTAEQYILLHSCIKWDRFQIFFSVYLLVQLHFLCITEKK